MKTHTHQRLRNSVMARRYRFLGAVQKLAPEVLARLEQDVLPLCRAMFRDQPRRESGETCTVLNESGATSARLWITWTSCKETIEKGEIWTGPSWSADICAGELDQAGLMFRDAMERWAATCNLRSDAILGDAFITLLFWLVNPFCKRVWLPPGAFWTPAELANVPKLRLEDQWNFEPLSVVEKRLKEQIAAYKSAIKNYSANIGFDVQEMRDNHHHEWLALFQCRGLSPQKIRDWHKKEYSEIVEPNTVSHAIQDLAKRIGLERRPAMSGLSRRT